MQTPLSTSGEDGARQCGDFSQALTPQRKNDDIEFGGKSGDEANVSLDFWSEAIFRLSAATTSTATLLGTVDQIKNLVAALLH